MEETTDIFSQEDYFEIAIFEQYKRKVIKACEAANELDCSILERFIENIRSI